MIAIAVCFTMLFALLHRGRRIGLLTVTRLLMGFLATIVALNVGGVAAIDMASAGIALTPAVGGALSAGLLVLAVLISRPPRASARARGR